MVQTLYTLMLKKIFKIFVGAIANLLSLDVETILILQLDSKTKVRYRNQYTLNQLHFMKATVAELIQLLIEIQHHIYVNPMMNSSVKKL